MTKSPISGPIRQIGYLSTNLDRDAHTWMTRLGVGPFLIFRGLKLPGTFRGEPTVIEMDVGFAFQGDTQIELIQQTNDAPSPYRKNYLANVMGPHHVAWLSDDFDADVARAQAGGLQLVGALGHKAMGRYAYFTTLEEPDVYYELLENSRMLKAQWTAHVERCAGWDGDPAGVLEVDLSRFGGSGEKRPSAPADTKWTEREQELHERAIELAGGADDFGDRGYLDGLRRVLASYDETARFHKMGRMLAERQLIGLLAARANAERWTKTRPRIVDDRVERPIFILGMVRTGSTALHYLMGSNPDTQSLEYWLASKPQPRPPRERWATDPDFKASVNELNMMYASGSELAAIHHITADGPEECRHLLAQNFTDDCFEVGSTVDAYADWYRRTKHTESYRRHKRMVQLVGSNDVGRRWLLKYPVHVRHLEALLEVYPDACIVQTHRDPATVLPSYVSLCTSFRRLQETEPDREAIARYQMEVWAEAMERTLPLRDRYPGQFHDVFFGDFMADPIGTVAGIYDRFGVEFTDRARATLEAHRTAHPPGKEGKHVYATDDFGVSRDAIHDRFATYMKHFDLSKEPVR